MDDIRHIKCSQDEAEAIMDEMTFGGCKRLFVDSSSDERVWHLAAINDASEACIYCDFFDPWLEDPTARCKKGLDPLTG